MKKIIFPVAALVVLSFASCKKDRVCTCTWTSTEPGYTTSTDIETFTDAKKSDARAACSSISSTDGGYTYTRTCELK